MNKFEIVSKYIDKDGHSTINLPVRATKNSTGYDFEVAKATIIPSYNKIMEELSGFLAPKIRYMIPNIKDVTKKMGLRPTLVPTGIKCQLDPDKYLEITVRSSTPLNAWLILANGEGIIDADYYNNESNEGEIFFQIINLSPVDIVLQPGDKIGQGIIKSYSITDDDAAAGERVGGFGSTNV